jgi:hypothetical protein
MMQHHSYKNTQMRTPILLCALCVIGLSSAHAADGSVSFSTGFDYSSGDYGSASRTETWAIPLSLKYKTDDWSVRVSTAWLRIVGSGSVTAEGDPTGTSGTRTRSEGAGDLITAASYTLLDPYTHQIGLDLGGKIKFGTADAAKFLGTGKNDYSLQTEVYRLQGAWMPYLSLGYKWKGSPSGIAYRNVGFGAVGSDYRFSRNVSAGASYEWQQTLTASSSGMREATFYLAYRLSEPNRINLYVNQGYSNASADWGSGVSWMHRF